MEFLIEEEAKINIQDDAGVSKFDYTTDSRLVNANYVSPIPRLLLMHTNTLKISTPVYCTNLLNV